MLLSVLGFVSTYSTSPPAHSYQPVSSLLASCAIFQGAMHTHTHTHTQARCSWKIQMTQAVTCIHAGRGRSRFTAVPMENDKKNQQTMIQD